MWGSPPLSVCESVNQSVSDNNAFLRCFGIENNLELTCVVIEDPIELPEAGNGGHGALRGGRPAGDPEQGQAHHGAREEGGDGGNLAREEEG